MSIYVWTHMALDMLSMECALLARVIIVKRLPKFFIDSPIPSEMKELQHGRNLKNYDRCIVSPNSHNTTFSGNYN